MFTIYNVGNMHDKFKGCTVDVQAATMILNNHRGNVCYVHMLNAFHYAVHDVSVMDERFQTGTVNVHNHALNLNNQYLTLL